MGGKALQDAYGMYGLLWWMCSHDQGSNEYTAYIFVIHSNAMQQDVRFLVFEFNVFEFEDVDKLSTRAVLETCGDICRCMESAEGIRNTESFIYEIFDMASNSVQKEALLKIFRDQLFKPVEVQASCRPGGFAGFEIARRNSKAIFQIYRVF